MTARFSLSLSKRAGRFSHTARIATSWAADDMYQPAPSFHRLDIIGRAAGASAAALHIEHLRAQKMAAAPRGHHAHASCYLDDDARA